LTLIVSEKDQDIQALMDELNTQAQTYLDEYWANK